MNDNSIGFNDVGEYIKEYFFINLGFDLFISIASFFWFIFIFSPITAILENINSIKENPENIHKNQRIVPNYEIKKSLINAIIFVIYSAFVGIIIGGMIPIIYRHHLFDNRSLLFIKNGGLIGLGFGLFSSMFGAGGNDLIKHFILRIILWKNNSISWNYAKFLDYATEILFMQKVGGGYIFIHRMLMEHFANMKLDKMSRQ